MYKIISLLALGFALLPFWRPQGKPTDELEIDRQEVVNLENETARALQLNNATFFKRVYSEDFIATSASGLVMDKATFVNSVQYSDAKFDSFIATDIRVRFYQDTAVVNCLWTERGKLRGQVFSNQSRILHVYINGPRGWQAVASQETPLPGAGR
jgi:predicted GNAT superfamily acetyltransferase